MTKNVNCWKPSMICTAKTECDMLHIDVNALKTVQGEAISSMSTSNEKTRICSVCKRDLPLAVFKQRDKRRGSIERYLRSACRDCTNAAFNIWVKQRRDSLRDQAYAGYGGVCACCGEWRTPFLTIDHVNND